MKLRKQIESGENFKRQAAEWNLYMMHRNSAGFWTVAIIVSLFAATAQAGPLYTDSVGVPGFQNYADFFNQQTISATTYTLSARIEFNVYAPGTFSTSAALGNPTDPSGGADYIYAYEVINNGPTLNPVNLSTFTVGLFPGAIPPNSYIGDDPSSPALGVAPNTTPHFSGLTSAAWTFAPAGGGVLSPTKNSDILFFASPQPPSWNNGGLIGGHTTLDTHLVPSPVPEPSSVILMVMGVASLLVTWFGRKRARSN